MAKVQLNPVGELDIKPTSNEVMFVGGKLDGTKETATFTKNVDLSRFVVTINQQNYRYKNGKFVYTGDVESKENA